MPFIKIDIVKAKVIFFTIFIIVGTLLLHAQPTPRGQPDVSNKTLITNAPQDHVMGAAALHKLANDYYNWRNENDPVGSSERGLHTWDDKLGDYSPTKINERAQHVRQLLDKVRAFKIDNWSKDDKIDALLFRSQLENVDFGNRVLKFELVNPQTYTGECSSAIFSLLKKEYDTPRKRARALSRCVVFFFQERKNRARTFAGVSLRIYELEFQDAISEVDVFELRTKQKRVDLVVLRPVVDLECAHLVEQLANVLRALINFCRRIIAEFVVPGMQTALAAADRIVFVSPVVIIVCQLVQRGRAHHVVLRRVRNQ